MNDDFIPMGDDETPYSVIGKLFDTSNINKITDLNDVQIAEMTKLYFFTLIFEDELQATQVIRKTIEYYNELNISRNREGRKEIRDIMKGLMNDVIKNENKNALDMAGVTK